MGWGLVEVRGLGGAQSMNCIVNITLSNKPRNVVSAMRYGKKLNHLWFNNLQHHLTQVSHIPDEETGVQSGCDLSMILLEQLRVVQKRGGLFPLTTAMIHFVVKKNLTITRLTLGMNVSLLSKEKKTKEKN